VAVPPSASAESTALTSAYARSAACRHGHADIYQQWSQTDMAMMFWPYRSENVVGGFTRNNTFYEGHHGRWANGDSQIDFKREKHASRAYDR
jgi:hypothetical protein